MRERKYNYLKITMHDNDFTAYYRMLGNIIKELLWYNSYYDEYDTMYHRLVEGLELNEDMMKELKTYIEDIWYSLHNSNTILRFYHTDYFKETPREEFIIDISLIDYLEATELEDNNYEDIYIPLFSKDAEVLLK